LNPGPVRRIAIFAALQWECRPVLRQMRQVRRDNLAGLLRWNAEVADVDVTLVKTGVGMERADRAARTLCAAQRYDLLLSSGCAGALAGDLIPGDLVLAEAVVLAGGESWQTQPEHGRQARAAAERAGLRPRIGGIFSSPVVLATSDQKRAAAGSGAIAVEMEGAAIARVAAEHDIPFGAVRSILDPAETRLDQSGGFVDPATGSVRPLALAGHLLRHPSAFATLREMKKMMDAAESSLQRFFSQYLASP